MVKIGTFWVISIFKEYSHHLVFAEFMNYSIADLRPSRLKTFYKYDDRVNLWTTRELIWTCQMPPFNINSKSKGEISCQPQTQRN